MIPDLSVITSLKDFPFIYAFLIGVITAMGPCPFSANVTAIAYVSSRFSDPASTLISGAMYTAGRALTYSVIGVFICLFGSTVMENAPMLQDYDRIIIGPMLILTGLVMLEIWRPVITVGDSLKEKYGGILSNKGVFGAFSLGIIFALAFCPYTAVMFFGLLIPFALSSDVTGVSFPLLFGIGTGVPVILFAILLAVSAGFARTYIKKIVVYEPYLRKGLGSIFIIYGVYMVLLFILSFIS